MDVKIAAEVTGEVEKTAYAIAQTTMWCEDSICGDGQCDNRPVACGKRCCLPMLSIISSARTSSQYDLMRRQRSPDRESHWGEISSAL